MRRETLLDFFESFAAHPNEFLVYFDGYRTRSHTYKDVASAARRFCERLAQAGLAPGDRVLFWGENRPEWIVALWGCLLRGVVVVPLDYRASSDLLVRVQQIADARLLLLGDETVQPPDTRVSVWPLSSIEWRGPDGDPQVSSVNRDSVAEILFTSGATAEPKGVIIQHRNILAHAELVY